METDQVQISEVLWRPMGLFPLTRRSIVTEESLNVHNGDPHQGWPLSDQHELTASCNAVPIQMFSNTVRMECRTTFRSERARMTPCRKLGVVPSVSVPSRCNRP